MTSPSTSRRSAPDARLSSQVCHVVSHVHWDREWYRPHEQFRARLVELVERVCDRLESGELSSFHLDGQTIVLADVLEVRPDLEDRIRGHVVAGRLTVGPWHVLADNQLVSTETLVRNLLIARRWGARIGRLADVGYSPDAFGHPADLPRLLRGFGIDTALVWRGAPPDLARFRWRSPDGSEVFTVNQRYHEAEVLWDADEAAAGLTGFVAGERAREPRGPWLLLNGGDHLVPVSPASRGVALGALDVPVVESSLARFFHDAREAASGTDLPVVEGELRRLGGPLTFLLSGTLSTRTYLKQANARAQALLEGLAEPAVALSPASGPDAATRRALLDHAWDLAVQNAPHDSVCGCSVDEVHDHNLLRASQSADLAEHLVRRSLLDRGLDTRVRGEPAESSIDVVVLNGLGAPRSGPVEVEVAVAPTRFVAGLLAPDGTALPVEAADLGTGPVFAADLDLLPDTRESRRHRVRFRAEDVPAFGQAVFRVLLGEEPGHQATTTAARQVTYDGRTLAVAPDGSFVLTDPDSRIWSGLGRLVDGGDRGDTYNYDPPARDELLSPRVVHTSVHESAVRATLVVDAVADLPTGLADDRSGRSTARTSVPVRLEATLWRGEPDLHLSVSLDNRTQDHRLRLHVAAPGAGDSWDAGTHWSALERPLGPPLGPLPDRPSHEALCAVAPVHGWARAGSGADAVAVLPLGLPEVQGLAGEDGAELAVTLLRSVGWLSRFDLASRTAGAGPMLATPGAQCPGPFVAEVVVRLGADAADTFALASAAQGLQSGLWAAQLGTSGATHPAPPRPAVSGALVTALKPPSEGPGYILRVWNPTEEPRTAVVRLPTASSVHETRLDETPLGTLGERTVTVELRLGRYDVRTLRVEPLSG